MVTASGNSKNDYDHSLCLCFVCQERSLQPRKLDLLKQVTTLWSLVPSQHLREQWRQRQEKHGCQTQQDGP